MSVQTEKGGIIRQWLFGPTYGILVVLCGIRFKEGPARLFLSGEQLRSQAAGWPAHAPRIPFCATPKAIPKCCLPHTVNVLPAAGNEYAEGPQESDRLIAAAVYP
jgi:hypothetical protein